jgi:hypothetical protein
MVVPERLMNMMKIIFTFNPSAILAICDIQAASPIAPGE